jgi:hypothetical protein
MLLVEVRATSQWVNVELIIFIYKTSFLVVNVLVLCCLKIGLFLKVYLATIIKKQPHSY